MKTQIIAIAVIFAHITLFAQSNSVFIQEIAVENPQPLMIDLDHSFIIESSENKVLKIETHVTLKNGGQGTLQHLNRTGQYKLSTSAYGQGVKLLDNPYRQKVLINKQAIQEEVHYVIYVPKHLVMYNPEAAALLANDNQMASSLLCQKYMIAGNGERN